MVGYKEQPGYSHDLNQHQCKFRTTNFFRLAMLTIMPNISSINLKNLTLISVVWTTGTCICVCSDKKAHSKISDQLKCPHLDEIFVCPIGKRTRIT